MPRLTRQASTITPSISPRRRRWLSRILRNFSETARGFNGAKQGKTRHKRSLSDITTHFAQSKEVGLDEIIRICGKNLLRLPPEHAPSPLVVPTCLRATAHYLVQNGKPMSPTPRADSEPGI
ncbi:hypothetical protein IMZ48_18090 [Candidatus Bathyarchaeota archaeon]|nr:hypothetical protein [Candidatus Bathyarchaeota archaeon]